MDSNSNSQYPYEDMPEGRKPERIPPTPGAIEATRRRAIEATRRRVLKQGGMTDAEIDAIMSRPGGVDEAARAAIVAANERQRLGTTRADSDMIDWVERFVNALHHDHIHPIDF